MVQLSENSVSMESSIDKNNNNVRQFGDTTMTKIFVGGLAWETPEDALRDHFNKYGQILEAVIIFDKFTGKSKGYGFVTFKEAEAAKKACEDSADLVINGRRANCNLAFLGARRPKSSSPASSPPQHKEGSYGGEPRSNKSSAVPANQVQCYYPVAAPTPAPAPASPFHHQALPFYGYTPTYIAADINYNYNYNQKLNYGYGGAYMNGHHVYPRPAMVGANPLIPVYPTYQFQNPTVETMGIPAHMFYPTAARHFAPVPAAVTTCKPTFIIPHTGTVGTGQCYKRVV